MNGTSWNFPSGDFPFCVEYAVMPGLSSWASSLDIEEKQVNKQNMLTLTCYF